jgi:hypothetical protein
VCVCVCVQVAGLYRGIGPQLALVSNGALQFMLYEECKAWLGLQRGGSHRGGAAAPDTTARRDQRDSNRALAGASASGSASAASTGAPRTVEVLCATVVSKTLASCATYPLQVRLAIESRWSQLASECQPL